MLNMPGSGEIGTAYSKAAHIVGPRTCATPVFLKAHPVCLQYIELVLRATAWHFGVH